LAMIVVYEYVHVQISSKLFGVDVLIVPLKHPLTEIEDCFR